MEKEKGRLWQFFLENWRFTYIIGIAILLIGGLSILQIPKESNPDVTIPIVTVNAPFPGASAEDVEEFVIKPIENQVLGIADIDQVSSYANRGNGTIVLEFLIGIDIDQAVNDVKSRVDIAKSELPSEADDPIVNKISLSDEPILSLAIAGPYSVSELTDYAKELKDSIEKINGVGAVDLLGGQEREVRVLVDKAKLDAYGLSIGAITNAIRTANSDIPLGEIETGGENYILRFAGRIENTTDIGFIPITAINDVPVYIRDIATIEDGFTQSASISSLGVKDQETVPSVSLSIKKTDGQNVLTTVDKIYEEINLISPTFPEGVRVEVIVDFAEFIRSDLTDLGTSGLQTIVIVMILLFIFLGWREAILAGAGIPIAFLITFGFLTPLGFTLNFLTMFSLILALGIIVDASIVMTEGIYTKMQEGYSRREAAIESIKQFNLPLIAGTFTTIFAFLPMMMSSGIIGEYIKSIPVTVSIVLIGSLIAALGMIPAIGIKWLKRKDDSPDTVQKVSFRQKLVLTLQSFYRDILETMLSNKTLWRTFFAGIIILFVASLALPARGILKVDMFPASNMDTIFVDIEAPFGTPLSETKKRVEPITKLIEQDDRVDDFLLNIGGGSEHTARFVVNLIDDKNRPDSLTMIEHYEEVLGNSPSIQGVDLTISQLGNGPEASSPIEIRITGPDLLTLDTLSLEYENYLKTVQGTRNVGSNIEETNGEFRFVIDRTRAAQFGVTTSQIAGSLRNAIYGVDATTVTQEDDDIDVIVKYDLANAGASIDQVDISTLEGITIATNRGDIPLSSLVMIEYGGSRSQIERRDGTRIARVTSDLLLGYTAQEVFAVVDGFIAESIIPEGYTIETGGEREDIDQSFSDLFRAMILGMFMIAALLVWQFKSYRQPLFIMLTIPLSLIGVLPGLAYMGQPLSFPGMIGVVALAGIVVNNAIILVDQINTNRREGMKIEEAVKSASISRLQPILLTTITTIAGILPITLSNDTWGPLGFSIIFGLLFSTVLTLIVVPLLYIRFNQKPLDDIEEPNVCYIPKISLLE